MALLTLDSRLEDIKSTNDGQLPHKSSVSAALSSRRKFGSVPSARPLALVTVFPEDSIRACKSTYSNNSEWARSCGTVFAINHDEGEKYAE
jgi:hypothetical protein